MTREEIDESVSILEHIWSHLPDVDQLKLEVVIQRIRGIEPED